MIDEASGVVLVLFDRDAFRMGAQRGDPSGPNHDAQAQENEGPVHEVELSPYFLSKYELTQGQWLRLTGDNPSLYRENWAGPRGTQHHRAASCRAGELGRVPDDLAAARWASAAERSAVGVRGTRRHGHAVVDRRRAREPMERRAANLADSSAKRAGAAWMALTESPAFDDGFIVHAPVGSFAANPYGLHEVAGNLWELCQDGYDPAYYSASPSVDPLCDGSRRMSRIARGGSYDYSSDVARSATRGFYVPTVFNGSVGARPGRAVDP